MSLTRQQRRQQGLNPLSVNRCGVCGRFRSWEDLIPHFVPDTAFSSEDESWQECEECRAKVKGYRDE